MATRKPKAATAAPQTAPCLSLAEIAGYSVDEAADEFAGRVRSARRLFVEQGKLVQHIRAAKLKKGQTVYGILQSRHGVSQGSIDIAIKVAEILEAVVLPGHLPEARFDEVLTFRIANRARSLLSGKGHAKLTPEQFAAILASGDPAAIGDDLDCLVEHGVTVKDREAAIAAKDKAEAVAKAEADAKAKAEEDARKAAELEAESAKVAAAKVAEELAAAQAKAKADAEELAKAKADLAEAKAAAPSAPAPAATAPAPAATPTPVTTAEEGDEDSEADGDEDGDADPTDNDPEPEDEEATLEAILDRITAAIQDAANLDPAGIKAVVHFLKKTATAMEREMLRVHQAA